MDNPLVKHPSKPTVGNAVGRCTGITDILPDSWFTSNQNFSRESCIANLLVRIHCIIVIIGWTGLAPWEFEISFPGSLISRTLHVVIDFLWRSNRVIFLRDLHRTSIHGKYSVSSIFFTHSVSLKETTLLNHSRHARPPLKRGVCGTGAVSGNGLPCRGGRADRATSLIRNRTHLGPYTRTLPMVLRRS